MELFILIVPGPTTVVRLEEFEYKKNKNNFFLKQYHICHVLYKGSAQIKYHQQHKKQGPNKLERNSNKNYFCKIVS